MVYNTMSRTKEPLVTLRAGELRMYSCGVTVYDLSHVGHAKMMIVFDVIARYLRFAGYRLTFVRNFTDIEDKIIRLANQEGVSAREISERDITAFRDDIAALGVQAPEVEPKATDHVPEMIALIERLVSGGYAYVVDGDVYFEVRRFPTYGKLSGRNLDELLAGARVDVDERKRDPRDFALWKAAKPDEPAWPSPWGPGRPGWHIECSAMAMRYLGESFDIHGGGEDLIFPHHECEIAQAEAVTHKPFARYWVHNGFVNMGKDKMSKSLGNTLTIRDIVKRHDPEALRLWILGTHYRHLLEWSEERVEEAARALARLTRVVDDAASLGPPAAAVPAAFAGFAARFTAAMDDDFNTPQALGVLFEFARALSDARDRGLGALAARGNPAARLAGGGHAGRSTADAQGRLMAEGRVYGRNPVLALLRSGGRRADEIAVLAGGRGPLGEVVALARRAGVKVSFRTREQLTAMAGSPEHQGVVARVTSAEYVDLEDLLAEPVQRSQPPFYLVLDQVQDPRNLGAILRTAEAFGVHGVVIPKHHAVGLTDAAARTAMGAIERVPVARATNLVSALETIKESGTWVYGAAAGEGVAPWAADLRGPVCLVLGGEGEGLRPLVARACDVVLAIPMVGAAESLNVAAAAAVLCYEVSRQRHQNT